MRVRGRVSREGRCEGHWDFATVGMRGEVLYELRRKHPRSRRSFACAVGWIRRDGKWFADRGMSLIAEPVGPAPTDADPLDPDCAVEWRVRGRGSSERFGPFRVEGTLSRGLLAVRRHMATDAFVVGRRKLAGTRDTMLLLANVDRLSPKRQRDFVARFRPLDLAYAADPAQPELDLYDVPEEEMREMQTWLR